MKSGAQDLWSPRFGMLRILFYLGLNCNKSPNNAAANHIRHELTSAINSTVDSISCALLNSPHHNLSLRELRSCNLPRHIAKMGAAAAVKKPLSFPIHSRKPFWAFPIFVGNGKLALPPQTARNGRWPPGGVAPGVTFAERTERPSSQELTVWTSTAEVFDLARTEPRGGGARAGRRGGGAGARLGINHALSRKSRPRAEEAPGAGSGSPKGHGASTWRDVMWYTAFAQEVFANT